MSIGVTDPTRIQQNVREAIHGDASLFSLGFGYDLNYGLLDGLAKQNDGLARRIYEASDAALQLQVSCTETLKDKGPHYVLATVVFKISAVCLKT